jgi:antitoxin component YwqK of YwqJK toxin-antitoxin module
MKKSTKIIISAVLVTSIDLTSGYFYMDWRYSIDNEVSYNDKKMSNYTFEEIEKPNGIVKKYFNSGELQSETIYKDDKEISDIEYDTVKVTHDIILSKFIL